MTSTIEILHGPALIAIAVLALFVCFMMFVTWWALLGWGTSIAHRVYRWGMGTRQTPQWTPAKPVEDASADELDDPSRSSAPMTIGRR
jgi:hypothetical protein